MIKYRLKIFLSELVVDKSRILPAYFFTIDFSKKKKKLQLSRFHLYENLSENNLIKIIPLRSTLKRVILTF